MICMGLWRVLWNLQAIDHPTNIPITCHRPSQASTDTIATLRGNGDTISNGAQGFGALESRSARLRLKIGRRPYSGPSLARGIALMYRRNKTNGTWVLKASNGHGAYWTKAFALADDFEDVDAKSVLTFYQAQDQVKQLARGDYGGPDCAPVTVDSALKAYRRDLEARGANPYNAEWPRLHLTSVLLSKPVALLAAIELKKWRDGLRDGTVDDQSALSLPMRRIGAGGAARQAHSEPGCLGNRSCRSAQRARSAQCHHL